LLDKLRFLFTGITATGEKPDLSFCERLGLLFFPRDEEEEFGDDWYDSDDVYLFRDEDWPEDPHDLEQAAEEHGE
jgi:hypothetical protein